MVYAQVQDLFLLNKIIGLLDPRQRTASQFSISGWGGRSFAEHFSFAAITSSTSDGFPVAHQA